MYKHMSCFADSNGYQSALSAVFVNVDGMHSTGSQQLSAQGAHI